MVLSSELLAHTSSCPSCLQKEKPDTLSVWPLSSPAHKQTNKQTTSSLSSSSREPGYTRAGMKRRDSGTLGTERCCRGRADFQQEHRALRAEAQHTAAAHVTAARAVPVGRGGKEPLVHRECSGSKPSSSSKCNTRQRLNPPFTHAASLFAHPCSVKPASSSRIG